MPTTITDAAGTDSTSYDPAEIEAAYKAIYGGLPSQMMDKNGNLADTYQNIFPGAVLTTPTGQQIQASQLMYMYQAGKQQQAASTPAAGSSGSIYPGYPSPSYLSAPSQGNSMATSFPPPGTPSADQAMQYFVSMGGSPNQDPATVMQYYQAMQQQAPAGSNQNAFGISQVGGGPGYTTLANNQGQQISVDNAGNYFSIDANGNHTPITDQQAQQMGFQSTNPETQAIKQMQQIDPNTENLRQQLSSSYTDPNAAANPTAAQYQSYLDTFKQVDPTEYAERSGLATSMDSYLKQMQDQNALGSQLDPVTQMQVEQQARKAQADRGNLYGSGQAAVEAMTTGQAGQALQLQRQQQLQAALQGQQSYLGAGLGLGDTAMQLYQQGLQNKANAQQSALSYLTSGATPYQAGASYLSNAEGAAANAAQGGPVYNPTALGAGNLGTAQQAPQYGLDIGAQSQNYFNSLNNAYGGGGAATKNRTAAAMSGAASGALSGAVGGATIGSAVPVVGTAVGAVAGGVLGGVAGGAGGYYS
jgi:hypothetical protein